MSSPQVMQIPAQLLQTAHSPQSSSETIASDTDTPIASIVFEDAAARAIRWVQRESKGKANAKYE